MSRIKDEIKLEPGNYAVIFLSERPDSPDGYSDMDEQTMEAVSKLPGFLGYESARVSPFGMFISYWKDLDAINAWRTDSLHAEAKQKGRSTWYTAYRSVVCKIEETHQFRRE
ncbi:MAG: antibiotic biosynthesis monooxygenase [Flavobacteriales bacterium]